MDVARNSVMIPFPDPKETTAVAHLSETEAALERKFRGSLSCSGNIWKDRSGELGFRAFGHGVLDTRTDELGDHKVTSHVECRATHVQEAVDTED